MREVEGSKRRDRADRRSASRARLKGPGGAIVYTATRRAAENIAEQLGRRGWKARAYHAGLPATSAARCKKRSPTAAFRWSSPPTRSAWASIGPTCARSSTRSRRPRSKATTKRSGAPGATARRRSAFSCSRRATSRLRRRLCELGGDGGPAGDAQIERAWALFRELLRYVDAATCRHDFILRYFGDEAESLGGCGHCDVCREVEQTLRDDPEVLARDAIIVRKALSGVARARGRGGTQAVAEMLRGKSTDRVVRFGFDGLSTFGLLAGETQENVMRVLRALLAAGCIDLTPGDYPMPILTATGAKVMRGEEAVRIRLPRAPAGESAVATKGKRRGRKAADDEESPRPAADGMLFEALRVHRLNIASESGIAPFIVAHDRTLAEMAARRPTTLAGARERSGDGAGQDRALWRGLPGHHPPRPRDLTKTRHIVSTGQRSRFVPSRKFPTFPPNQRMKRRRKQRETNGA